MTVCLFFYFYKPKATSALRFLLCSAYKILKIPQKLYAVLHKYGIKKEEWTARLYNRNPTT